MAAIISSEFRKRNADLLKADVANLYIGLGRSDDWENSIVPLPTTSDINVRDAKESLIGLKQVESAAKVIPRVDYSTTKRFKQWDPTDHLCVYPTGNNNQCYAVYDGGIWLCINSPVNGSDIRVPGQFTPTSPTLTATVDTNVISGVGTYGVTTLDTNGYRWAFLGKIPTSSKFISTQFVEIPAELTAGTNVSNTAGKIYSAKITSAGSGYSPGTYTGQVVSGNGTGATATITVDSTGKISNVQVTAAGTGYTYGIIIPSGAPLGSGGSGGRIDFFPGPLNATGTVTNSTDGYGRIAGRELPCWFVGLSADVSGLSDTDIPTIPFSQLSVLRQPSLSVGSGTVISALQSFVISSTNNGAFLTEYAAGSVLTITNGTVTSKVFFDRAVTESSNIRVYYHRNSSRNVNYTSFTATGFSVTQVNGITLASPASITSVTSTPEYTRGSGEVMFIENFKKKSRFSTQTDQIRLIIQL